MRSLLPLKSCLLVAALVSGNLLAQDIDPSKNSTNADRCRKILEDSLVDFYVPHSKDEVGGGYHEALDEKGDFVEGEKFLTLQSRQIWFISNLAANKIKPSESQRLAEHGCANLRKSFYDQENGGYYELFDADWKRITDTEQWGVVGTVGFKTYNSHLHLLEAFTQLYLETKKKLVAKRLEELISICTKTIKHPDHDCNIDAWTTDWKMVSTPKNLRASYGHDLECAWLVLAAAEALGKDSKSLNKWAVSITDHAIKFGFDDEHGGFFYSGPLGKPSDDRKKEWWTQSEALVGLLTIHKITNVEKYMRLFERTLDFVGEHHVASNGGWFAALNEDGSLGKTNRKPQCGKAATTTVAHS